MSTGDRLVSEDFKEEAELSGAIKNSTYLESPRALYMSYHPASNTSL